MLANAAGVAFSRNGIRDDAVSAADEAVIAADEVDDCDQPDDAGQQPFFAAPLPPPA